MRRTSSAWGGSVSRRSCSNQGEAGEEVSSISSATYCGESRRKPGSRYHSPAASSHSSSASGTKSSGSGR